MHILFSFLTQRTSPTICIFNIQILKLRIEASSPAKPQGDSVKCPCKQNFLKGPQKLTLIQYFRISSLSSFSTSYLCLWSPYPHLLTQNTIYRISFFFFTSVNEANYLLNLHSCTFVTLTHSMLYTHTYRNAVGALHKRS